MSDLGKIRDEIRLKLKQLKELNEMDKGIYEPDGDSENKRTAKSDGS